MRRVVYELTLGEDFESLIGEAWEIKVVYPGANVAEMIGTHVIAHDYLVQASF